VVPRPRACLDKPRMAAIPPSSPARPLPDRCPGRPGVTLSGIQSAARLTGGGRGVTLSEPGLTLSNSGRPGRDPALIWPAKV